MTIVVCIPAHGASIKDKLLKVDKGYVLAPVRAGEILHFVTFNIVSKMLLEAASSTDPAKALQACIEWLAELPTTEIIKPGQTINEFSFSSAFHTLSKDNHLLPLAHLGDKYGKYMNFYMKDGKQEYQIYINKQVFQSTIPSRSQSDQNEQSHSVILHHLANGTLMYVVPCGTVECTASDILACLKRIHILVSSDTYGDNIAIEAILKSTVYLANAVELARSVDSESTMFLDKSKKR